MEAQILCMGSEVIGGNRNGCHMEVGARRADGYSVSVEPSDEN